MSLQIVGSIGLLMVLFGLLLIMIITILRMWSLLFTRAPFINVPKEILPDIVSALDLKPDSVLYDLGCGDGSVLRAAIQKVPGAKGVGIDNNILPYWIAKFQLWRFGLKKNIVIRRKNFFSVPIGEATHVFCYLYPRLMNMLEPKFEKELQKGAVVITCDFKIPNREPTRVIELNRPHMRGERLFVYKY